MIVTTTTDQEECRELLKLLGMADALKPKPPCNTCDGMMNLDGDNWVIATNCSGTYKFYLLVSASERDAWRFYNDITRQGRMGTRMDVVNTDVYAGQN